MSTQTFYQLQSILSELKEKYPWFDIDFIESKCFLSYFAFMAVVGKYVRIYGDSDLVEVSKSYRKEFFSEPILYK